jgi:hypothetical protein
MTSADRSLVFLLRLIGVAELVAIPFVFAPLSWMEAVHDRLLGLGPLPDGKIVGYLARHLSALYAVHGAMIVGLSLDLPRYRPLVGLLGWSHLVLGGALVVTDLAAGFSWLWVVVEGGGVLTCGGLLLAFSRGQTAGRRQRHGPGVVERTGEE